MAAAAARQRNQRERGQDGHAREDRRAREPSLHAPTTYISGQVGIYRGVTKHLVDIDEQALREARAELGTHTIKDTVNRALHEVGGGRRHQVRQQLDVLASAELVSREQAWR
jgi:Arc/MetJ family transcription regulator